MATIDETMAQAVGLHRAGHLQHAEQLYRQVLDADPYHFHALGSLAVVAQQADRPDEAIEYLRRAIALRPDFAELHSNLATAHQSAGDITACVAEYREALRLKPQAAPIQVNLGQALLDLGQVDEALQLGLEALRLQPDYPPAYAMLGSLVAEGRYTFADEDVRHLQNLLATDGLSTHHAALLCFTLGAVWDRRGNFDEAFRYYRQGNELRREVLRRSGRDFNPAQHRARIDSAIAAFTPEAFAQSRSFGVPSEQPVFVVGMVRSGTSLVEQILASHPRVVGCGELRDIEQIAATFYHLASLTGLEPPTIRHLAERYLRQLARLGGADADRAIDKMPHNFLHLGMIAVLFPGARVIHCRRDPLDVCVSAYVQDLLRVPYATRLEDLGFYFRQYERLMEHWRRVLPLRMVEIQYEELVADPERVSRELVAFCGLDWDDRCLTFHQTPRAVQTCSRLQVREPIYTRAVARWKRYEAYLQPLRDALRDALAGGSPSGPRS
jgi:tetratricopeptide (TPR) repeat protein